MVFQFFGFRVFFDGFRRFFFHGFRCFCGFHIGVLCLFYGFLHGVSMVLCGFLWFSCGSPAKTGFCQKTNTEPTSRQTQKTLTTKTGKNEKKKKTPVFHAPALVLIVDACGQQGRARHMARRFPLAREAEVVFQTFASHLENTDPSQWSEA